MLTQPDTTTTNIYKVYTQATGLLVTGYSADKLDLMVEDYGISNVKLAILQAQKYKKSSMNYILAILRNWKAKGKIEVERDPTDYDDWQHETGKTGEGDSRYAAWND